MNVWLPLLYKKKENKNIFHDLSDLFLETWCQATNVCTITFIKPLFDFSWISDTLKSVGRLTTLVSMRTKVQKMGLAVKGSVCVRERDSEWKCMWSTYWLRRAFPFEYACLVDHCEVVMHGSHRAYFGAAQQLCSLLCNIMNVGCDFFCDLSFRVLSDLGYCENKLSHSIL